MFDKERIIYMTKMLEFFANTHKNIYILPETLNKGGDIFPVLKRINPNVVGILTNAAVIPGQNIIQTASGSYPLLNIYNEIPNLNSETGIVISSANSVTNPIFPIIFKFGNTNFQVPAFAITNEEALAIYDRLTTIRLLQQYQEDGVITNVQDISIRFARGMSTFINSEYQDVKVQVWDRREFKIPSYDIDDTAIVIQGPLEYKDNYTLSTVRLYREWYPNVPIIISTWKNEVTDAFRDSCKQYSVIILENNFPKESGVSHVNYQIESSLKGIGYVKNHTSSKYVLKCRTDQRINRTDFLIYLRNLLNTFPPNGNKLNERIILFGTDKWIPFYSCDFFYFGTVEDVRKIFDIPLQSNKDGRNFIRNRNRFHLIREKVMPFIFFSNFEMISNRKLRNYSVMMNKFNPPEIFILKSFYNNHIEMIDPPKLLQTYWKFLHDYVIVVERNYFMLDWPKYQNEASYRIVPYYDRGIDYPRWLDIYLNYKQEDK